jgi:hypothetical protein
MQALNLVVCSAAALWWKCLLFIRSVFHAHGGFLFKALCCMCHVLMLDVQLHQRGLVELDCLGE